MPTYEYRCEACGHELELFQSISEEPKKKCPACKKPRLKRLIGGGAGFLFKGSGFYLTDYRSDSYKKAAEAETKPSDAGAGSSGSADGAKSDGKATSPAPGSAPGPAPGKDKKAKSRK
jgi:putative FmdB family regulatory protein